MRFLAHTHASQQGHGCLVPGIDRREHPVLFQDREQVVEQGDHRQRAEALALVRGRNGEADLDLVAIVRQEVDAEITDKLVRGRRSDSQLMPGVVLVKRGGRIANNEGPGIVDAMTENALPPYRNGS